MHTRTSICALLLTLCGVVGDARADTPDVVEMEEIIVTGLRGEGWSRDEILTKMEEARQLLAHENPEPRGYKQVTVRKTTGRGKSRKTVSVRYDMPTGRPLLLAAWSKREERWHIIKLELECPTPKCWHGNWHRNLPNIEPVWVTPGYAVNHVRGSGRLHLVFTASRAGERLYIFGWKYPDFDTKKRDVWRPDWRDIVTNAKVATMLPPSEDTFHSDFVSVARQANKNLVEGAFSLLRERRVMSRAYPGELVADVIPRFVPETIAVIEQADTEWPIEDEVRRVYHRIGMHGFEAFSDSVSSKDARGYTQFIRSTYVSMVHKYPTAGLNPDYASGVQDPLNSMMATICLLDNDLAARASSVKKAFRTNPGAIGAYLVVAYNGGPRIRTAFHNFVMAATKRRVERLRVPPTADDALDARCPCVYVEGTDGVVRLAPFPKWYNRESKGYVQKFYYVLITEHSTE